MHRARIIPVLLVSGKSLVKTIQFAKPNYVGDPLNAVRIFNEKQVDELIVLDIMASKEGRGPNIDLVERLAQECFMPLCYGGGITSEAQVRAVLAKGVEKVAINTAALGDIGLLTRAADLFGSQSIVGSIDCRKDRRGTYGVFSHARTRVLITDPVDAARAAQEAGAGELLINSVDNDGVRNGFDYGLCATIASSVQVPVIACGGGGTFEHFKDAILKTGVAGAAGGSYFVYQGKHRAVLITYPRPELIEGIYQQDAS